MKILAQDWSHKVNALTSLVALDGPDYWYAVQWQSHNGQRGSNYHDHQQALEFFQIMCPDSVNRDNQKINDVLGGFDTHALGYRVTP